jgi:exosortase F-associated protein
MQKSKLRWCIGVLAVAGLLVLFVFQKTDVMGAIFQVQEPRLNFIGNRSIRFVLNDILAIALLYALFAERKYVVFALWVQLFGFLFLLVPYFFIRFNFPAYNGPLINFLHRIILNPILILLLIPAFYSQQKRKR